MTTKYLATQWGTVDQATKPEAFVHYLDSVSAPETIQRIKERTYDLLQVREGHHILDVACGAGDDLQVLAQRVGSKRRVVGVDCSETMVAVIGREPTRVPPLRTRPPYAVDLRAVAT